MKFAYRVSNTPVLLLIATVLFFSTYYHLLYFTLLLFIIVIYASTYFYTSLFTLYCMVAAVEVPSLIVIVQIDVIKVIPILMQIPSQPQCGLSIFQSEPRIR